MTIDDVQYLRENGIEDSITINVDSSKRDYRYNPTPSEYVVPFIEPVKMVVGLEILDGSIPSTMYNIDRGGNMLKIYLFRDGGVNDAGDNINGIGDVQLIRASVLSEVSLVVPILTFLDRPIDIDLVITTHEQYADAVSRGFSPLPPASAAHESTPLSSPATIFVRHVFHPDVVIAGPQRFADDPEYAIVTFRDPPQVKFRLGRLRNSRQGLTIAIRRDEPAYKAVIENGDMCLVDRDDETGRIYLICYEAHETRIESINEYTSSQVDYGFLAHISSRIKYLRIGNYDIEQLQNRLNQELSDLGFQVRAPQDDSGPELTFKLEFVNGTRFAFDMDVSTVRTTLGYDTWGEVDGETRDVSQRVYVGDGRKNAVLQTFERLVFGDRFRMYGSVYDPATETWRMISPGIINLTGDRYVTLRCREIEEHMSEIGLVNHNRNGIGTFKLAEGNQITFVRFDFISLSRKPFHPIGKLSRLTLRFERSDGSLYDFKGVNHQLLVNVRRLVTDTRRMPFHGSQLNPSYVPDPLRYMLARSAHRAEEEPPLRGAGGGGGAAATDVDYVDAADAELLRALGGGAEEDDAPVRVDDRELDYSSDDDFEDEEDGGDIDIEEEEEEEREREHPPRRHRPEEEGGQAEPFVPDIISSSSSSSSLSSSLSSSFKSDK